VRPPENWFELLNLLATTTDPDFRMRGPNHGRVCGLHRGKPDEVRWPQQSLQETRGTSLGSVCLVCGEGEGKSKDFSTV
jgi:hypothetical protein